MIKRLQQIAQWFDDRLHLTKLFESTAGHHVPKSSGSWFYVFGSGTLLCLMLQLVTGTCLAFVYVPSADEAYLTLEYLTYQQPLGWFLRALHYWGSNFMVGIMMLHMAQVFLFGAYKYPRELTWITGVLLMFVTLGLAFTGQVMRFDQDAYWGLGIGTAIMGRVPIIGSDLVHLMLAGPIIAGETLSRFFTLHVFILPGTILALIGVHLRLVLAKGINEYPKPGVVVKRETYDQEYEAIIKKEGVPFVPAAISKDLVFSALVMFAIFTCAAVFGPKGPKGFPDPTYIQTAPQPDFFFLWVYSVAALLPPYTETFVLLVGPVVATLALFALPFISNTGEKSARKRPIAVLTVVVSLLALSLLTWAGIRSPWSPEMTAWTSDSTPAAFLKGRSPLELQGALVLQYKQCRNCHSLDGIGGERGPDLSRIATRLTRDQLIRQVIQGGGNMPAYGKNLSPAEVEALVAFMLTLHPSNVPPVRDSTIPAQAAL
ncbi:MAG: cytochrome b N-terminal domain-containing protein [Verrucomicrobia bacterium]|nr:cytochrome b N-terminal domain-containing protein [Verrucomicrobiota bacterium]